MLRHGFMHLSIMAKEIERKFLVTSDEYRGMSTEHHVIEQAYLSRDVRATVRVRIIGEKAFLTVKGRNEGAVRDEWEYEIPVEDARGMIERCSDGRIIVKTRWIVDYQGMRWEVDEFGGEHKGLTVAEIELPTSGTEFDLPSFAGKEVTGDIRYYNSSL